MRGTSHGAAYHWHESNVGVMVGRGGYYQLEMVQICLDLHSAIAEMLPSMSNCSSQWLHGHAPCQQTKDSKLSIIGDGPFPNECTHVEHKHIYIY